MNWGDPPGNLIVMQTQETKTDLRAIRKLLTVRTSQGIPFALWGLYSLAWGKPIPELGEMKEAQQNG